MARLRKFCAYRRLERPYTRRSKFVEKSYVKANPALKIVRFEMGAPPSKSFDYVLNLKPKAALQIRHDALESARQTSNRFLESSVGKNDYFMKIMVYPHHVLRENPLAAGAGADRMSTGMQKSFGKPIGFAAQVKEGKILCSLSVDEQHLETARKAMKRFSHKIPCPTSLKIGQNL